MNHSDLFLIVFEDGDLLVVNKPAGLVCHPTKTDAYSSLVSRVRLYLGPDARPHLVNRLDRETSGVTLVAKTDEAAREIRKLWEQRRVVKEYLAIVSRKMIEDHGVIEAPLGKDMSSRVAIKDCVRSDGQAAKTEFWRVRSWVNASAFSLVRVRPHTGRKHQIRIHLAHAGHPIVGDKLYGVDEDLYLALVENRMSDAQRARLILPYHALHAAAVEFAWRGQVRSFRADPEPWFRQFVPDTPASITTGWELGDTADFFDTV